MTPNRLLPLLLLIAAAGSAAAQQSQPQPAPGVLDLTQLYNYADQPVPAYINPNKDNTPANNEISDIGATLGRVLFYDKRLSVSDTVSCASCHQQEHGFSDPARASAGVAGTTRRHSMRLINARFANEGRFFWDERATSAEDQATKPIQDHVEMGFSGADGDPSFADLVAKLGAIEEYQVLFTATYGNPAINETRVQRAIAQFVRSIQSFDSKYDAGRAAAPNDGAPFTNFTAAENAGKQLFLAPPPQGGAGCAGCHQPPEFDIDPNSGNNGVIGSIGGGTDTAVTRAPSLRDLVDANGTPHTSFMHDGGFPTLASVIAHYNQIPAVVNGLDPRLTAPGPPGLPPRPQQLNLTANQQANLAAFLRTLTGENVYTDPKWSNPFDAENTLRLIVLPQQGAVHAFSGEGEDRLITLTARGVPGVTYRFQESESMREGTWSESEVVADEEGVIEITMPAPASQTQCFYRFAYVPAE
ncbi:MAG: cytochrome-c peroxidase [Verrucomicrobiales bacterium]